MNTSKAEHDRHMPFCIPHISGVECFGESCHGGMPGGDFLNVVSPVEDELLVTLGTVPRNTKCAVPSVLDSVLIGALQATFRVLGSFNVAVQAIAAELNRLFWEDSPSDHVGCLFAARVTPRLRRIEYVTAGDQLVLLCHATGYMERLECNAPPLGLSRHNSFRQRVAAFTPGDTLIAVTEGAEAGLDAIRHDLARARVRDISSRILDAAEERAGGSDNAGSATVDRTALVIHWHDPNVPRAPIDDWRPLAA